MIINDIYGHAIDGASDMMDFAQLIPLFAVGAAFFVILFAYNLRKPKSD